MAKHIGIAAVSPEGSALCYRDVFRYASKRLGDHGHPIVTLHNNPLERYVTAAYRDDWHTVGELLATSAKVLASAGAEFAIVPDNLMQHGVHLAESLSPIPWLTMTELVTEAVVADGRKVVGVIGTKMVMYGSTYQTHLGMKGVRCVVPDDRLADEVDRIIFKELVIGQVRQDSIRRLLSVLEDLKVKGCEGIILASTEVPLAICAENCPLPLYDSTQLLAEGAVRCALGERPIRAAAK
ncbi:MAG TPA: amino acid racemase [Phycisphaerales bacterium]|nr:amino acid racemase [Phycisphaerales bacterium]